MRKIEQIVRAVAGAVVHRLKGVDPKVLATAAGALVSWLATRYGFDVQDPTVSAIVALLIGAIAGVGTPNAGSGLADRWTPAVEQGAAPVLDEPDGVPGLELDA